MSGLGVVHLLYNFLRDLPVWYRLYTYNLNTLFLSDSGEPYKSIQEVYENIFSCRLFAIAVSGVGVVHLFHKVLRDIPVWYKLCSYIA